MFPAYQRYHCTETIILSVPNDVIRAADKGKVTCLVLLGLSAAFDTVDRNILLDVLRRRFLAEETARLVLGLKPRDLYIRSAI